MSWWTVGSSPTPMPILPPSGEEVDRIRIPDDDPVVVIPPDEPIFFPDDPGWISEPGMLPPNGTEYLWKKKWGMLPIEDEEPEGWYPDDPFHFG